MIFEELAIEITRKCNLKCEHCMRGESQDSSITKEIIDKIFKNVEDCQSVAFLGGEPLLEIELIEYLVTKIIKNWNTEVIQLTTNGTLKDKRIIEIFNTFCKSKQYRQAFIIISADEFHNKNESDKTYNYFLNLAKNTNIELIKKEDISQLKLEGRAIEYIKNNPKSKYLKPGTIIKSLPKKHRIKVIDNKTFCSMLITTNGDLSFNEEISFNDIDKISIGNIKEKKINELIKNHNCECLLTCCDTEMMANIKWSLAIAGISKITNENIFFILLI